MTDIVLAVPTEGAASFQRALETVYDIRSAKLRMAVQDRVVFKRDVDRPENLTVEEQERYDMAISLGGHNAAE